MLHEIFLCICDAENVAPEAAAEAQAAPPGLRMLPPIDSDAPTGPTAAASEVGPPNGD